MAHNMSHATRDLDTQQNAAGGIARAGISARRPPAHRSVSLKHSSPAPPGACSTSVGASVIAHNNPPPPTGKAFSTASSLINHKASSGESSNADTWFERSNKNVARGSPAEDGDNSPPFFVQHSSTDTSNHPGPSLSLPFRSAVPHLDSMGSSSEEYRSVIDDLTVQNKRLKKRLKGYERFRDRNTESEAMFEVKMRGLSRDKKRELEKLLADFALNAHVKPSPRLTRVESASTAQFGERLGAPHPSKPSSSLTSTRGAADSGYGSMSTSNQGSNSRGADSTRYMIGPEAMRQRDRSIHSYLHDIPEGLLPKPPNVMTEKAKKKLVVQRLEQIFGGRGASIEGHQQPIQQQKVSTTAAEDDRKALEAKGDRATEEGVREAFIMNEETEEPMDFTKDENSPNNSGSGANTTNTTQSNPNPPQPIRQHSKDKKRLPKGVNVPPEQRPTRPLDLDPHRAQIPLENMDYLRHLGFDIPIQETTARAMTDEQGWIYLNVMINMAQLHTVNVTTDLVRQAVKDYSKMFEMSSDGRKIRWKGHHNVTNMATSSSSGAEQSAHSSIEDSRLQSTGEKRPRPADLVESSSGQLSSHASKRPAQDKFQYTPIFRRQIEDEDDDISMAEDAYDSSPVPEYLTGESSALATSSKMTGSGSRSRRQDDGPLVFYKDRHFFIDLSADRIKPASPAHSLGVRSNAPPLLGTKARSIRNKSSLAGSAVARHERRYFSYATTHPPYHAEARRMAPADDSDVHMESDAFSPRHVTFVEPDDVVKFEASGVAGITPEDNMAIQVVRGIAAKSSPEPVRRVSSRLDRVLKPKRRHQTATEKILSVRKQELEPSKLPPPSFAYSPDEGSDMDDDSDDGSGSDDDGPDAAALAAQPVVYDLSDKMDDDESMEEESEDDSEDDDQSLDFLADARAVNPAAVYAKEREYDAAMAERLAEEIPAGSSAATAGGGSGFNSPVGGNVGPEGRARTPGSSSKKQRQVRSVSS